MWHLLDVGSIWMKEFAAALGSLVPLKCWVPEIRNFGWKEDWERDVELEDPVLRFTSFPLQRGYGRFPIGQLLPIASKLVQRLLRHTEKGQPTTLVCTSPFYAPVAERWPGRVIYYLTDLTAAYPGMNRRQIQILDRRMCCVADLVCPNSPRIGEYLRTVAGCSPQKILVVPNATRAQNLLRQPLCSAAALPADLADLPRPVIGVMGNLASNLDWHLLRDAVGRTPEVSWVFVGPVDMQIQERDLRAARSELMKRGGRTRFTGAKPYGALCEYARAFDVALLPYRKKEPTFSGSATRYYEHLAACRPILATPAVDELLTKEPLLKLVDSGAAVAEELKRLRENHFQDGFEDIRCEASHDSTWETRARVMLNAADGSLPEAENTRRRGLETTAAQTVKV
jgi:glycosyltransferase involved in cell wall biosynthesis